MTALEEGTADLHMNVRLLHDIVTDLDTDVRGHQSYAESLEADLIALEIIKEARKNLAVTERELQDKLGEAMGKKRLTVMGTGVFERSPRRAGSPKVTDESGLWRLVLDTRIVDPDTGEVLPPHEVIKRVYGSESRETHEVRLTGATPTKVEALGIDPDDFFEKAPVVGYTIQLKS